MSESHFGSWVDSKCTQYNIKLERLARQMGVEVLELWRHRKGERRLTWVFMVKTIIAFHELTGKPRSWLMGSLIASLTRDWKK